MILITGAAGFIGSALAHKLACFQKPFLMLDKLSYAGHYENISSVVESQSAKFIQGDIQDYDLCLKVLKEYSVSTVMNLAAETHVDNSIQGPKPFIETNISGTYALLEATRAYWSELPPREKSAFRFLHISTDEVFGELGREGYFTEATSYSPRSPYSASKAASDHLVRAWHHTYGLPTIVTNCSNNYGPRQFPEKLIPRMIDCALRGEKLPVYGKGENIRDWIHVEDHVEGLLLAYKNGEVGETYCFGGRSERKNLDVVTSICKALDVLRPRSQGHYADLISFVTDRAGHDFRYAIDDKKAETELGFRRQYKSFEEGLMQTVKWYLENTQWIEKVKSKK
ncbi:MAG: dTDP-glucose 4,6-dehydratase [Bdellovibrionales bacterium]|nr:dTDP-glucose 4,6-dehydratase [Bdellovibrionales bacterium]